MPSLVQIDLVDFLMMLCLYTGEKKKETMHHKFTMDDERHQVLLILKVGNLVDYLIIVHLVNIL
jgi:hypothetical protein